MQTSAGRSHSSSIHSALPAQTESFSQHSPHLHHSVPATVPVLSLTYFSHPFVHPQHHPHPGHTGTSGYRFYLTQSKPVSFNNTSEMKQKSDVSAEPRLLPGLIISPTKEKVDSFFYFRTSHFGPEVDKVSEGPCCCSKLCLDSRRGPGSRPYSPSGQTTLAHITLIDCIYPTFWATLLLKDHYKPNFKTFFAPTCFLAGWSS